MGLDMYLSAKKYHSTAEWRPETERAEFGRLKQVLGDLDTVLDDQALPYIYIEVSVGYWRKANAVHQWFVDNCQNGEDDCRVAYVPREKMTELLNLCEQVLLQPATAKNDLPTQPGFFFGSYEYDGYYFDDLKATVGILKKALEMPDCWEFYYHSSW